MPLIMLHQLLLPFMSLNALLRLYHSALSTILYRYMYYFIQWLFVSVSLSLCKYERRSTHLLTERIKFYRSKRRRLFAFRTSMNSRVLSPYENTTNTYASLCIFFLPRREFFGSPHAHTKSNRWRLDDQIASSFSVRFRFVNHSIK